MRVKAICCLFLCLSPCQAFDEVIDSPMYVDPPLPGPRLVLVVPERAKELWLRALERPEAEPRRRPGGADPRRGCAGPGEAESRRAGEGRGTPGRRRLPPRPPRPPGRGLAAATAPWREDDPTVAGSGARPRAGHGRRRRRRRRTP